MKTTIVRILARIARFLVSKAGLRAILLALIAVLMVSIALVVPFKRERRARAREWAEKVTFQQPRPPAEIRGLQEAMIRSWTPGVSWAAIPPSMWDNSACAAAVIQMVNFLRRDDFLRVTDAWKFELDNPGRVTRIYDRDADFQVQNGRIVETYDRTVWFSMMTRFQTVGMRESRTSARMYVLGYRYHETRADPAILAAREQHGAEHVGMNSHLMILLGRANGQWWGYHLFHDPAAPGATPFRVEPIGEDSISQRFDIVRVWQIGDVELPLEGVPMRIYGVETPYDRIATRLGGLNGFGERIASFWDTARMGMFRGPREYYPRVDRLDSPSSRRPATITPTAAGRTSAAHPPRRSSPAERRGRRLTAQLSTSRVSVAKRHDQHQGRRRVP